MADNESTEDGAPAAAPKSRKKLIMIAGAVLVLASGVGAYFAFFSHPKEVHVAVAPPKLPSFIDVPEILVNLAGQPGERVQYLKVKVVLEIKEDKQVETIKPTMPRITDIFQTYLRELRASDLSGSVGMFRLKEELTKRVNATVSPLQVNAVLFKEIVIQ